MATVSIARLCLANSEFTAGNFAFLSSVLLSYSMYRLHFICTYECTHASVCGMCRVMGTCVQVHTLKENIRLPILALSYPLGTGSPGDPGDCSPFARLSGQQMPATPWSPTPIYVFFFLLLFSFHFYASFYFPALFPPLNSLDLLMEESIHMYLIRN